MGKAASVLGDVRGQVAPADETLSAARERRRAVLAAAEKYHGSLRSYLSGSIAHGTANDDTDADCGIVLDRRSYPALGPDGEGEGPADIVESLRCHLREELCESYDDLSFRVTKRAITIKFNDPVSEGVDPDVDLIVALNRRDEPGLWIPNTDADRWDPSDPETHTALLTSGTKSARAVRARVVRLAKAWNNQYARPGLCSFNLEALALAALDGETDVAEALAAVFSHAARDLRRRLTPDPAGVSGSIKLKLEDRDVVIGRLDKAASHLEAARAADDDDDDEGVQDALANVFWDYVEAPESGDSKAALAQRLRRGAAVGLAGGSLVRPSESVKPLKSTRAYGGADDV